MNEILQKRIEEEARNYADSLALPEWDKRSIHAIDFKKGAIFALQNQWISVDEALPDDDENVLLTFNDGHIIVAYHSGNYWWWCDGFVCGIKTNGQPMYSSSQRIEVDDNPTHWIPIPKMKGGEK